MYAWFLHTQLVKETPGLGTGIMGEIHVCHTIEKRVLIRAGNHFIFSVLFAGIMIGLKTLAVVIYHADELHQWVEMRREVAHQTNLFELSLGGHSPLNEFLSQSQLSVCITCGFKEMQGLM